MTTYIYHKDSTLMAFECEQREVKGASGHIIMAENQAAMSTARESALLVVNANDVFSSYNGVWLNQLAGTPPKPFVPGEPVALPGWWLEKVEYCNHDCCQNDNQCVSCQKPYWKYRLVRSEPDGIEMNHAVVDEFTKPIPIKLTLPEKPIIPVPLFTEASQFSISSDDREVTITNSGLHDIVISDGNNDKRLKPSEQFFVRYKDGKFILPPIEDYKPVGEKPENSAHGDCKECTSYFGYPMSKCFHCKPKVSEPSESQEEIMCELFQRLYDCLERGKGTLQNVIRDFTITRK